RASAVFFTVSGMYYMRLSRTVCGIDCHRKSRYTGFQLQRTQVVDFMFTPENTEAALALFCALFAGGRFTAVPGTQTSLFHTLHPGQSRNSGRLIYGPVKIENPFKI